MAFPAEEGGCLECGVSDTGVMDGDKVAFLAELGGCWERSLSDAGAMDGFVLALATAFADGVFSSEALESVIFFGSDSFVASFFTIGAEDAPFVSKDAPFVAPNLGFGFSVGRRISGAFFTSGFVTGSDKDGAGDEGFEDTNGAIPEETAGVAVEIPLSVPLEISAAAGAIECFSLVVTF